MPVSEFSGSARRVARTIRYRREPGADLRRRRVVMPNEGAAHALRIAEAAARGDRFERRDALLDGVACRLDAGRFDSLARGHSRARGEAAREIPQAHPDLVGMSL